jgi:3'-5' exoribonuclease
VKFLTIAALKEQADDQAMAVMVDAELQSRSMRQTKAGKPYLVLSFADATGSFNLNAWSDAPMYEAAGNIPDGAVIRLDAEWTQNQYGLNATNIAWERLTGDALEVFYAGDEVTADKQRRDW